MIPYQILLIILILHWLDALLTWIAYKIVPSDYLVEFNPFIPRMVRFGGVTSSMLIYSSTTTLFLVATYFWFVSIGYTEFLFILVGVFGVPVVNNVNQLSRFLLDKHKSKELGVLLG